MSKELTLDERIKALRNMFALGQIFRNIKTEEDGRETETQV